MHQRGGLQPGENPQADAFLHVRRDRLRPSRSKEVPGAGGGGGGKWVNFLDWWLGGLML